MSFMAKCEIGDYILIATGEIVKIKEIRTDIYGLKLWCDSLYAEKNINNFKEWNEDGIMWNSDGINSRVTKILDKEKNPEYWL